MAIITSLTLTTASASLPTAKPNFSAEALVMTETTSIPGVISKIISSLTEPMLTALTVPFKAFLALIFMV